jgi:hypothetical protein
LAAADPRPLRVRGASKRSKSDTKRSSIK